MEQNKLLCLGDPILDIYIGNDGSVRHFNGGALNIYQNILALLEDEIFCKKLYSNFEFGYPGQNDFVKTDIANCYTICRTPLHPSGIALADQKDKDCFYTPCGLQELTREYNPNVLVLGDYNKGTLNYYYDDVDIVLPEIEYVVVDSRYRSLDLKWLNNCKTKIWHATNSEYDENWQSNFDYVFWTNGPEEVKVLTKGNIIATLPVPLDTKVVETCGSGDAFTATIAACLFKYKNAEPESLIDYARLAIDVCQDVVSRPYTATTNKRIGQQCSLQI